MFAAIYSSWALLLGIAFIQLGNGLQTTLLGVRATMEAFPTSATGAVMARYQSGSVRTYALLFVAGVAALLALNL